MKEALRIGAARVLRVEYPVLPHSCDVHDPPHPATWRYRCDLCKYVFYFCDRDGPATLRMFHHPLICGGRRQEVH